MEGIFNHTFMGAHEANEGSTTLLGCPLDATSSFRGGTRFAPASIRKASWTLETYSPYLKLDLDDITFRDAGDLELRQGDLECSLGLIQGSVAHLVAKGSKPLLLGGEHLVTYPIMRAIKNTLGNGEIQIVHFDAHCDLRDDYLGERLSHATVMKRVKELGGVKFFQIGIRSGTRKEFEELAAIDSAEALAASLSPDVPVYVTFDLDVLDPSLAPGVTTPEPGGLMFGEVLKYFSVLRGRNIVGCDVVELAPDYDTTFVSSVCAAKVVRELVMLMSCS